MKVHPMVRKAHPEMDEDLKCCIDLFVRELEFPPPKAGNPGDPHEEWFEKSNSRTNLKYYIDKKAELPDTVIEERS